MHKLVKDIISLEELLEEAEKNENEKQVSKIEKMIETKIRQISKNKKASKDYEDAFCISIEEEMEYM